MAPGRTYRESGVDVGKGEALVERIKALAGDVDRSVQGIGGFAALYRMEGGRLLAASADGVGTKLKVAQRLGRHGTIGVDLVAMSVNDLVCVGAEPLFFLDYLAVGRLDLGVAEEIIGGVVAGCRESGAALIGGETAEMPGLYADGEYDLAGFAVGEADPGHVLDGSRLEDGMELVGLASSGLHANGFSLARRLIGPGETDLLAEALVPTRIYAALARDLREGGLAAGLAHITGGGFANIPRMGPGFDYRVESLPPRGELPPVLRTLAERSGLGDDELHRTFNMGVGLVVATGDPSGTAAAAERRGVRSWRLGRVAEGKGRLAMPWD